MAVVLLTGMSGAGKSTVLGELAAGGHAVVDTDHGDWIVEVPVAGQLHPEPLWRDDRISELLDGHGAGHLFLAGCVANQGTFYPRLDAVVLLTAPADVLLERVATRTTNPFGLTPADRARITADITHVEPLLQRGATAEIDTRRPVGEVVATILAIAGAPAC